MGWQDQGRQYHMQFGHGTAPDAGATADPSVVGKSTADRALALAYGAIASLPPAQRRQAEAQYQAGALARPTEAMAAWMRGLSLDEASFASRFFGRGADDPVVRNLHGAALDAAMATSHAALGTAAGKVAAAMAAIGLDRWPRFVADAQERARDPATLAAVEQSKRPPEPGSDAIRRVYPIETALGIVGAGSVGGGAAVFRAIVGASAKQALSESRPPAGNAAANVAKPESAAGNVGKQAEPMPRDQPVRLHAGQQGKHIEGSKNNNDPTRSTLTADPQELLNRFAGRGEKRGHLPVGQPGSKEAFDTGEEVIGIHRPRDGISAPTTRGIIHYSKRGAHIVPATPRK